LTKALEQLSALRQRPEDRREGLIRAGKAPTLASVEKQCREALSRQHLKALVRYTVTADDQAVPVVHYEVSTLSSPVSNVNIYNKVRSPDRSNRAGHPDWRLQCAAECSVLLAGALKRSVRRFVSPDAYGNAAPSLAWATTPLTVWTRTSGIQLRPADDCGAGRRHSSEGNTTSPRDWASGCS
jgi:hypothetical protein